jgi:hypothetical protein
MEPMTEENKEKWKALVDFIGFPPPMAKLWKIMADLISPDSDRARVLIVASMIDKALHELLRWKFMQTAGVTKKDCDFLLANPPISPIGSFAVRSRMAFVLGLISRKTLTGLTIIKDFRNLCAHEEISPFITEAKGEELFSKGIDEHIRVMAEQLMVLVQGTLTKASLSPPRQFRFVSACLTIWSLLIEPVTPGLAPFNPTVTPEDLQRFAESFDKARASPEPSTPEPPDMTDNQIQQQPP